jgi:hypothetical protein
LTGPDEPTAHPGFGLLPEFSQNAVLLKRIKVIWVVQSFLQKYSGSHLTQITCISLAVPSHTEGRFAIVTDVGRGMRWTQAAR